MTILVAVFVAFTFIGARIQGERFSFEDLEVWRSGLRSPLKLFFLLVVIQSLATFVKTGNIMISGIGLIAYLSPVPAMLVAYYYCRDEKDITKFLEFYLLMSVIMVSGVYLSYAGFDWEVLSQVGSGIIAYASSGELI
ncbi:MAG TPA: hypothetical protein VJW95_01940, partial [Dissulfurispiraceae bacterium]|nr:hypothetical protein [Dissulfurispiraceae bacterium]